MLAVNYADNAQLRADSVYSESTEIYNSICDDFDLFYASGKNASEAVIDIELDGEYETNVLIIGEKIELGERMTSFKLECIDTPTPVLLANGTSVGYFKAVHYKSGIYKHLRLTLTGIVAPITLRHLALHKYDEDTSDPTNSITRENLVKMDSATVVLSPDRKEAIINFGGIFPFDTISFVGRFWCKYEISAFDGSKFYTVADGDSSDYRVTVRLDKPIDSSYQIKIACERGFSTEPDFCVY